MSITKEQIAEIDAVRDRIRTMSLERDRLQASISSLESASAKERPILSRLDAMDLTERNAMTQWIAAGAQGDAPEVDHDTRQGLQRELGEAQRQAKAMLAAADPLREQVAEADLLLAIAMKDLKLMVQTAITSRAAEVGERHRKAQIDAIRAEEMLLSLRDKVTSLQDASDTRTLASLPVVEGQINLPIQFTFQQLDDIRREARVDADERWNGLADEYMRLRG